jgi:pyruvate,water dikinase
MWSSLRTSSSFACLFLSALLAGACSGGDDQTQEGECQIVGGPSPDALSSFTCRSDFDALASEPLDSSLPGAQSVKVVLDLADGNALYFQNSKKFKIHYEFASTHLSGGGRPLIPTLSDFNQTEYFSPSRRFVLGAVTYYSGPGVFALELAPYDTASAELMNTLYTRVRTASYFGPQLVFHPTSDTVAAEAARLPASIPQKSTDELYAAIDYQPLNLGTAVGRLHFLSAASLAATYVPYRDIVVLDHVPNDISVVQGIITEEFQTPLSHLNVLSQNRHNPNMGLRGATTRPELLALDGKWVRLEVGAQSYQVTEVSAAEAEAWWNSHKPTPVTLPAANRTVTALTDIGKVTVEGTVSLREAIKAAVLAFGGKAAQYSVLFNTPGLPIRRAFAIPIYYYDQFMVQNGFYAQLDALAADASFRDNPAVRDAKLAELRTAMGKAPLDAGFLTALQAKIDSEYPGRSLRFRSSTNSEDLEGFPCAGCYESHTGKAGDFADMQDAIRDTWASAFLFRTYEERTYYSIDHKSVVMALLVTENFPSEEANGVALTNNPYDSSGLQPGFYINVQAGGDAEVVHPPPGVTSDQYVYQFNQPSQPIIWVSHNNLLEEGQSVLSRAQNYELGSALQKIHDRFAPAYGPAAGNTGWYAMDVEFKFDGDSAETAKLYVKQARSNPGRGSVTN